jgi:hypothetical protein
MIITYDNVFVVKNITFGDVIKFREDCIYKVLDTHLSSKEDNDYIFKLCKIQDEVEFCRKVYNYQNDKDILDGVFPEYKIDDYETALKITRALFKALYNISNVPFKTALYKAKCIL